MRQYLTIAIAILLKGVNRAKYWINVSRTQNSSFSTKCLPFEGPILAKFPLCIFAFAFISEKCTYLYPIIYPLPQAQSCLPLSIVCVHWSRMIDIKCDLCLVTRCELWNLPCHSVFFSLLSLSLDALKVTGYINLCSCLLLSNRIRWSSPSLLVCGCPVTFYLVQIHFFSFIYLKQ